MLLRVIEHESIYSASLVKKRKIIREPFQISDAAVGTHILRRIAPEKLYLRLGQIYKPSQRTVVNH